MSIPAKLRFRAKGDALVTNIEKQERGVRSFVGRVAFEAQPGRLGFKPTEEPEEVTYDPDYVLACQAGDLEAADAETAKACNVPFELPSALKKLPSSSSGTPDTSGTSGKGV